MNKHLKKRSVMKQAVFLIALVVLSAIVIAVHTPETRYSVNPEETEQTTIYFGEDYEKPLGGFGSKAASRGSFGLKGTSSVEKTLPYNSFIARGRDPTRISNFDPNMRGSSRRNVYVELEPLQTGLIFQNNFPTTSRGAARLVSEVPGNTGPPRGTVVMQVRDLLPIEKDEVYEAWLVDEDTGYALSMGVFRPVTYGTTTFNFQTENFLHLYEVIMVTKEPFPDHDKWPGDDVVLVGSIPQTRAKQPEVARSAFYLR